MKQNQKGITLVGLLVTIVVIIIIAGVCIYTGRDIIEEAKLEQLKTNMLLIQAKCNSIEDKVTAKEEANYIGTAIQETDARYDAYGITKPASIDATIKFYELSADDVKNKIGLGEIEVKDGEYLVDYGTSEVIYTPGYNGKHTLTQILEGDIE